MQIRLIKSGEEETVCELVNRVYDEFVGPHYTDTGNKNFKIFSEPKGMAERLEKNRNFLFVAEVDGVIVGMIEVRDKNHIRLLFVDKTHHGRGIARSLVEAAIDEMRNRFPDQTHIYVNAAPNAIEIYKKLGFFAVNKIQRTHGMTYLPMKRATGEQE